MDETELEALAKQVAEEWDARALAAFSHPRTARAVLDLIARLRAAESERERLKMYATGPLGFY